MPTERRLRLQDRLPSCPVTPPPATLLERAGDLSGRLVLDHGCGDAHRRAEIERAGATYVGLDPYSSSSDLAAPGDHVPLAVASVDAVVSNAVLHLVPDPRADVAEIGRVLKPGGVLVGYVGFLEGDPEQARFLFTHLALSETMKAGGLELMEISVSAYGLDVQLANLAIPFGAWPAGRNAVRRGLRAALRAWMSLLSAAIALRHSRRDGIPFAESRRLWRTWLDVSHAAGFTFLARKPGVAAQGVAGKVEWEPLLRCPRTGATLRRMRREELPGLPSEAEPSAAEWLVVEGGGHAYPILGRQLALSAERWTAIA